MATLVKWSKFSIRVLVSTGMAVFFWYKSGAIKPEAITNASGVIIGLSATLLGFLITSMALITALIDRRLISNMLKTGHYQRLMLDTILTCTGLISVIVTCLITLFLQGTIAFYFFSVVVFFTTLSLLYLIESGRRFSVIILNLK